MTEQLHTFNSIAPLSNVMALMSLLEEVEGAGINVPTMATFHGPSGYGKSFAAIYAANQHQAVLVQCKSFWTKKSFLSAILAELGIRATGSTAAMAEQVCQELARQYRPLLIDEADHLVKKNMVELVRDIYESSFVPIILIGEELLPEKLKKWERVHSRMMSWTPAQPVSERDVTLLVGLYCPGVSLDRALLAELVQWSAGSARRIVTNLQMVTKRAKLLGLSHMDMASWGDTQFYTGETPQPRRGLK